MAADLVKFFNKIQSEKKQLVNAKNGKDFEDQIKILLRQCGFDNETLKLDDDKKLKTFIQDKKYEITDTLSMTIVENTLNQNIENTYIYQPYGSQNVPDFIIFYKNKVLSIEIKYSQKNSEKPVWNSNLPKSNTIYIFGSYGKEDVTFFLGEDLLPQNERELLENFFSKETKLFEDKYRNLLIERFNNKELFFNHGFDIYIRKAFLQNKKININAETDFFKNIKRETYENNVKEFIRNL